MLDFFAGGMAPFTIALLVMAGIGIIELVSLFIGFSPTAALDASLPEIDVPEIDLDTPDASGADLGPLSLVLGWLSVGKVPLLVLLVVFLTSFAIGGYLFQSLALAMSAQMLPAWIAAIPAIGFGAYATRYLGRWFSAIFPREQTDVASQKDMIGSFATIIRGEAKRGQPAEAKTHDLSGRTHYVLVEPEEAGDVLVAGRRVFIVSQNGNIYRAVTRINKGSSNA